MMINSLMNELEDIDYVLNVIKRTLAKFTQDVSLMVS